MVCEATLASITDPHVQLRREAIHVPDAKSRGPPETIRIVWVCVMCAPVIEVLL